MARSARDRKTLTLHIRISPEQKRRIEKRARELGMGVSTWILATALAQAKEI